MSVTAAQYLWATLKSHKVMREYTKRCFYEHPSISAIIARHLAAHHLKPDPQADQKLKKLEELVKAMQSKVDGTESRVHKLEQKK